MRLKRYALAAAIGAAALAAPAAAHAAPPAPTAAPAPTASPATNVPGLVLSFTPPTVGPLSVDIGATIINGQIISEPVHVVVQPEQIDTGTWTWPSATRPADPDSSSDS
jgi:hypothetical protein